MVIRAPFIESRSQFLTAGTIYAVHPDGCGNRGTLKGVFLWDTGACYSLISDRIVLGLDLWVLNPQNYTRGIGGVAPSSDCAAGFMIKSSYDGHIWDYTGLFGTFSAAELSDIDVVIGMDIIQTGRLEIDKINGRLILSFWPFQSDFQDK